MRRLLDEVRNGQGDRRVGLFFSRVSTMVGCLAHVIAMRSRQQNTCTETLAILEIRGSLGAICQSRSSTSIFMAQVRPTAKSHVTRAGRLLH